MARYLTEYRHTDGTLWAGPEFVATSQSEAERHASEYPWPLRVVGEMVALLQMDHMERASNGQLQAYATAHVPQHGPSRMLPRFDRERDSDGCSVPTLLLNFHTEIQIPEVRAACIHHDEAYYYGGSPRHRAVADVRLLLAWLLARTPEGKPALNQEKAIMMFTAVRLGGGPQVRNPKYSWAFGGAHYRYDDEPAAPEET